MWLPVMEVGVAAMPPMMPPAATPAAADHDVRAAIVIVVAARVTVIAAVIISRRADSNAKRPRVESHLRHRWRRRSCGQQCRCADSKRKLLHLLLLFSLRVRGRNAKRRKRVPRRTLFVGNFHEKYLTTNSGTCANSKFIRRRAARLPAAVAVPLCRRATMPGTGRDKDRSPAW